MPYDSELNTLPLSYPQVQDVVKLPHMLWPKRFLRPLPKVKTVKVQDERKIEHYIFVASDQRYARETGVRGGGKWRKFQRW